MKKLIFAGAGAAALLAAAASCTTTGQRDKTATETVNPTSTYTPSNTYTPSDTPTPTPTFARLRYGGVAIRANQGFSAQSWFEGYVGNASPTSSPMANATVIVNGVAALWNATTMRYQVTPMTYNPGAQMTVTYNVPGGGGVWGYEPGLGSVQLPSNVSWTNPSPFSMHSASGTMFWQWTVSGASPESFVLTSLTNTNPTPVAGGLPLVLPGTQLSYTLPANSLYIVPGTPTPQNAILAVAALNDSVIQGSYEAAQATPTASLAGVNGTGNLILLNP